MFKKVNWRMLLNVFVWVTCLSGLGVLMSFVEIKKQDVKVKDVKILIPGANNFIEREEIDGILKQGYGELIGRNLETLNIHAIEQRLKSNPYIAFVKVYADMDGVVNIQVKQRQPVLRVINAAAQDFYIDDEGYKMPVSANFTASVLVATGNITEPFAGKIEKINSAMLMDLYKTALFIKKDTLWDAQFEQVYVDEKGDMELVPLVGIQKIILGNADHLETKMRNLLIFYKKAMPQVGWETYKTINVKYINQIVCEKNKIDSTQRKQVAAMPDSVLLQRKSQDSLLNSVMQEEVKALQTQAVKTDAPAVPKKVAPGNAAKPAAEKKTIVTTDKGKTSSKTQQNK